MKRKIPCFCDNVFEEEIPEEIDLDKDPGYLEEILLGSFFSFTCPSCQKLHKPEFPLILLWPSKKLRLEILPELDRGEFYRRKKPPSFSDKLVLETIIGYPEMADRLAVIQDGYEPAAVEAIKYFLHLKAEEQYPDEELDIWYSPKEDLGAPRSHETLEFHIHGIRDNEVAVMKVPMALYTKTLDDYKKSPKGELFSALRSSSYLSVKNTMRAGA
ncbi:MAG: CpXC domain-containing protein [Treponema sp.]|nr:CpXC domain-containing protein [Treponema sp.]